MNKAKIIFVISIAVLMVSCKCKKPADNTQSSDGVFIHLKNDIEKKHNVLMAFKMADLMSKDKDVLMYLDINAVNLLTKTAEDFDLEGFESYKTYLKRLIQNEVDVIACPACLNHAGIDKNQLTSGVKIAEKEKFFNFTNGKIVCIDY